ncbi:MAG: hypothetical protein J2O44_06455 [Porphyrobacter sp.]|nr:hypothetical protein [Porphyrobacter sp.]
MHTDSLPLPRGPRRSSSERLREELQALAGGHALFLAHSEKSWASVTFAGTRHRLDLAFEGEEAVEAAESFIAFLPEHEFAIPKQLVADAAVTGVDHRIGCDPRMEVRVELLLLEEE